MSSLPTGTVKFLFTDIEGSTRLLHDLGNRYAHVLAEHRRILLTTLQRKVDAKSTPKAILCSCSFPVPGTRSRFRLQHGRHRAPRQTGWVCAIPAGLIEYHVGQ